MLHPDDLPPRRPVPALLMQGAGVLMLVAASIHAVKGEPTHGAAIAVVALVWLLGARLL